MYNKKKIKNRFKLVTNAAAVFKAYLKNEQAVPHCHGGHLGKRSEPSSFGCTQLAFPDLLETQRNLLSSHNAEKVWTGKEPL